MARTNETILTALEAHLRGRYANAEYPALSDQLSRFAAERPFAAAMILDCTPLFTNTLVKFLPLLAGGARLSVGVSERVPYDPAVLAFVESLGVECLRDGARPTDRFDVILDCDGTRTEFSPRGGVAELTRSGAYRYASAPGPVVMVDDSRVKAIETSLGTGEGYLRGMRSLGFEDWQGRRVLLFGYGKVGRGVAYHCARAGAAVTVVDRADVAVDPRSVVAQIGFEDLAAVRSAVRNADHLITATGVRGAMRRFALSAEDLAAVVVSAIGIEDEWAGAVVPPRLVNGGQAVNFRLEEPTLLRYIDPTMALSNECARDLVEGRLSGGGLMPPLKESQTRVLAPVMAAGLLTNEIGAMFGADELT